jgi:hypothetical protein
MNEWSNSDSKTTKPPQTPMTAHLNEVAILCQLSPNDIFWQIEEYAERCKHAHPSSIDVALSKFAYPAVADYVLKDKRAIESRNVYVNSEDERQQMLNALEAFQNRIFVYISETGVLDRNGNAVLDIKLTEAEERRKSSHAKDSRSLTIDHCRQVYNRVNKVTSMSTAVLEHHRQLLIESGKAFLDADRTLKSVQKDYDKKRVAFLAATEQFEELESP